MNKEDKTKIKSYEAELIDVLEEKIVMESKISKMHEDKNVRGIRFDIYEFKKAESDLSILRDEEEVLRLKIKHLQNN